MRTDDFEAEVERCFLFPKRGRYIVVEDGFSYTGKLVIPDTAKRKPTTGTIIKMGVECDESWLGERVVYGSFSGTLIQFKGKPAYRILTEDEILAAIITADDAEEIELENVSA